MTTVCYQGTLLIDFKERKYKVLRRRQRKIFIGAQLCLIFLAVLKLWINREPIDGYIQLHSYATTPNRFTATLYCRTLKIELPYFSFFLYHNIDNSKIIRILYLCFNATFI